jgi:transposase-like protein
MNDQIIELKNRIISENIKTNGRRRLFSPELKQDIVSFVDTHKLSSIYAAQMIGIGHNSIERWRKNNKNKFNKIKVTAKPFALAKEESKLKSLNAIILNQFILITILILQTIEQLLFHLIF